MCDSLFCQAISPSVGRNEKFWVVTPCSDVVGCHIVMRPLLLNFFEKNVLRKLILKYVILKVLAKQQQLKTHNKNIYIETKAFKFS
jgi:hypothetical protein